MSFVVLLLFICVSFIGNLTLDHLKDLFEFNWNLVIFGVEGDCHPDLCIILCRFYLYIYFTSIFFFII